MEAFMCTKVSLLVLLLAVALRVYWQHALMEMEIVADWDACWLRDEGQCKVVRRADKIQVRAAPLEVPEAELEELRQLLKVPRWRKVKGLVGDLGKGGKRGVDVDKLHRTLEFWRNEFDWRKIEKRINEDFKPHVASIDGLDIHFWHVKARRSDVPAVPLLLMHGWPGSVWEFHKLIPDLQRESPAVNYEFVVPSLPGYGWSQAAEIEGLDPGAIAVIMSKLMTRALGYRRYFVQGGDWGSTVAHYLAEIAPKDELLGVHVNFPLASMPWWAVPYTMLFESDPREIKKLLPLSATLLRLFELVPYMLQQATRPGTTGLVMAGSPISTAAWILDKFDAWSDPNSEYSQEDLVTNLMFYWLPSAQVSSASLYRETIWSDKWRDIRTASTKPVKVPFSVSDFPFEPFAGTRSVLRDRYGANLVSLQTAKRGGHFAALENPAELSAHVHDFVRSQLRETTAHDPES